MSTVFFSLFIYSGIPKSMGNHQQSFFCIIVYGWTFFQVTNSKHARWPLWVQNMMYKTYVKITLYEKITCILNYCIFEQIYVLLRIINYEHFWNFVYDIFTKYIANCSVIKIHKPLILPVELFNVKNLIYS